MPLPSLFVAVAPRKNSSKDRYKEVRNAKIHRDYEVEDSLETGISLVGTEVKAIRAGQANINDAFARIDKKNEVIVYGMHIAEYSFGNFQNHAPRRPRKLLLHKKEILKLKFAVEAGNRTLVPRRLYFKGGLVKIELCLCAGKKRFDKREDLKKKEATREMQRALKARA